MATLTIDLPEPLLKELATKRIPRERLDNFVVEAIRAWLQRFESTAESSVAAASWSGAFHENAARFADQLIEDNQELFDELASK